MYFLAEVHEKKNIKRRKNFQSSFLGFYRDLVNEKIDEMILISINKIGLKISINSNNKEDVDKMNRIYEIAKKYNNNYIVSPRDEEGFIHTKYIIASMDLFLRVPLSAEMIFDLEPYIPAKVLDLLETKQGLAKNLLNKLQNTELSSL